MKKARGRWSIAVDEKDRLNEHQSYGPVTALGYSRTFKDLKPGTHDMTVIFNGVADGVRVVATGDLRVMIKGKESGDVKNLGKEKFPLKEDHDNGGKKGKGGKLARDGRQFLRLHPIGRLMLSVGLALLKWRGQGIPVQRHRYFPITFEGAA